MSYKSSVNLGLDNIPEPPEPAFFGIFVRVYNAIRNVALALDAYTGQLDADEDIRAQITLASSVQNQNLVRVYCVFGVDITAGQIVHFYDDAGVLKAELASAVTAAKPGQGWCSIPALAGSYGEVRLGGLCELIGGLTAGEQYYLGDVDGTIAPTVGTVTQYIGFALSSSALFMEPDQVGAGGGGAGTVTSVSVVTANGVSGTVATATTTPAITIVLGAITPTSVAAAGTVTGSNLSGTNTGDQTITLTGDVTGSGTGSFAATIANDSVTYAKLQDVSSAILLGRASGGAGNVEEITLGTNLSFAGTVLNASGGGGSVSFTAATLVVPTYGSQSAEVTVVDAAITALSKISIHWGNFTDADENVPDMDSIQFNAIPAAGSMIVRISALDFHSRVGGTYKINYLIG
jgi:hypothetical protein